MMYLVKIGVLGQILANLLEILTKNPAFYQFSFVVFYQPRFPLVENRRAAQKYYPKLCRPQNPYMEVIKSYGKKSSVCGDCAP